MQHEVHSWFCHWVWHPCRLPIEEAYKYLWNVLIHYEMGISNFPQVYKGVLCSWRLDWHSVRLSTSEWCWLIRILPAQDPLCTFSRTLSYYRCFVVMSFMLCGSPELKTSECELHWDFASTGKTHLYVSTKTRYLSFWACTTGFSVEGSSHIQLQVATWSP